MLPDHKHTSMYARSTEWDVNAMPKHKQRAAIYVRESDTALFDSTTIESAIKAVKQHCEKQSYDLNPKHEYKEAVSGYLVPYFERPQLMRMLKAVERQEFDVLVITEVRSLSRRGAGEVFIIYEALTKHNVSLESLNENFSDDPVGELVLGFKATYAKLEREQSYLRMQRGRKDRIEISGSPNAHSKPAYGYIFVDTQRERKGRYEIDHTIIYVDKDGTAWSAYNVVLFIFEQVKNGASLTGLCRLLNDMGIPTAKKFNRKGTVGYWQRGSLSSIIRNPIYTGRAYANRWINKENSKGNMQTAPRPREEWILLPDGTAPAIIDIATWEAVQAQLAINKQDSIRNNTHPNEKRGLLRAGYIFCGICGKRMQIVPPSPALAKRGGSFMYSCTNKDSSIEKHGRHRTQIRVRNIDTIAQEKIFEAVSHPEWIRARIEELRAEAKPVIDSEAIEASIEKIKKSLLNLYRLAENASDDETMLALTTRMNELEQQKREAESLLYDATDDDKEQAELEAELLIFEEWAGRVCSDLHNPEFVPTYEHLRKAVRFLGIRATVYPTQGEWPYRYEVDITVPNIMEKLGSVNSSPRLFRPISA